MKKRRVGFSLIELIVVMTVLSVVWLSITCVLYTLYRADHRLRDELQRDHAMNHLATRLRLDAHAAKSANVLDRTEGGRELVLSTMDERKIHYGLSDEGIYRIVRQDEAVLHRDLFRVGRVAEQWELRSSTDASLVVVTLTSSDGRSQTNRVQRIKAALVPTQVPVAKTTEASL